MHAHPLKSKPIEVPDILFYLNLLWVKDHNFKIKWFIGV